MIKRPFPMERTLASQEFIMNNHYYQDGPRQGKSYAEIDAIYKASSGLCEICGKSRRADRNLALDHDHKTGQLRGVLCSACNTGLGMFMDNMGLLRDAIRYLRRYRDRGESTTNPYQTRAENCAR